MSANKKTHHAMIDQSEAREARPIGHPGIRHQSGCQQSASHQSQEQNMRTGTRGGHTRLDKRKQGPVGDTPGLIRLNDLDNQ